MWKRTRDNLPPENVFVSTKIDDEVSERNHAILAYHHKLWWCKDGTYVYYTPTHWKPNTFNMKKQTIAIIVYVTILITSLLLVSCDGGGDTGNVIFKGYPVPEGWTKIGNTANNNCTVYWKNHAGHDIYWSVCSYRNTSVAVAN